MAVTVTCADCGHTADLAAPADVWKCNCATNVDSGCDCAELNEAFGTEDNPPDPGDDVTDLDAQQLNLRGDMAPKGDPNV